MGLLQKCLITNGTADHTLVAACIQAGATERSAIIGERSDVWLAAATLVGALIVYLSVRVPIKHEENSRRRSVAIMCSAEMGALETFFRDNNLYDTMEDDIKTGKAHAFHPGDTWLESYKVNPSSLSALPPEIVSQVVNYYCQMLTQLKLLRSLADNRSTDVKARTDVLKTLQGLKNRQVELRRWLDNISNSRSNFWTRICACQVAYWKETFRLLCN
jgi:hypothetical protein